MLKCVDGFSSIDCDTFAIHRLNLVQLASLEVKNLHYLNSIYDQKLYYLMLQMIHLLWMVLILCDLLLVVVYFWCVVTVNLIMFDFVVRHSCFLHCDTNQIIKTQNIWMNISYFEYGKWTYTTHTQWDLTKQLMYVFIIFLQRFCYTNLISGYMMDFENQS